MKLFQNSGQGNDGTSSGGSSSSQKDIGIKLNLKQILLDKDHYDNVKLVCTTQTTNAKVKNVTWKSSKPAVATVTNKRKS